MVSFDETASHLVTGWILEHSLLVQVGLHDVTDAYQGGLPAGAVKVNGLQFPVAVRDAFQADGRLIIVHIGLDANDIMLDSILRDGRLRGMMQERDVGRITIPEQVFDLSDDVDGQFPSLLVLYLRLVVQATMTAEIYPGVAGPAHRAGNDSLSAMGAGLNHQFSLQFDLMIAVRANLISSVSLHNGGCFD